MENDAKLLLYAFVGTFVLVAVWEILLPRRQRSFSLTHRWFVNGTLLVLNTVTLRLLLPVSAVLVAVYAEQHDMGLLNVVDLPLWLNMLIAIVLLDMGRYWVHRIFHQLPLLWRLHRVHHSDPDYDLTTGLRFHPFEAIVAGLMSLCLVLALGASPLATLISEVATIVIAFFSHGNARMNIGLDRRLRTVLVTPDMHRVHHSTDFAEANQNFSSVFSLWDRLFGSYCDQPRLGHTGMSIGLEDVAEDDAMDLWATLIVPFAHKSEIES